MCKSLPKVDTQGHRTNAQADSSFRCEEHGQFACQPLDVQVAKARGPRPPDQIRGGVIESALGHDEHVET